MDVRLLKKARARFKSRTKDCTITKVSERCTERIFGSSVYVHRVAFKCEGKRIKKTVLPSKHPHNGKAKYYNNHSLILSKADERMWILDIARSMY